MSKQAEKNQQNKCPENWEPGCVCTTLSIEPNDDCYYHGCPDMRKCPYCGQFRKAGEECKRCSCTFASEPFNLKGITAG